MFDKRDHQHLRRLVVQSPRATAAEIQCEMGASGDNVSLRTMQRALNDAGCSAIKPKKKPYLSATNIEKDYKWAQDHVNWTPEQ